MGKSTSLVTQYHQWRARAFKEYSKYENAGRQHSTQEEAKRAEPCPLCWKWYGNHYGAGRCIPRRLGSAPFPFAKELRVAALLENTVFDHMYYVLTLIEAKNLTREEVNALLNDVTVQAEQESIQKMEDGWLKSKSR